MSSWRRKLVACATLAVFVMFALAACAAPRPVEPFLYTFDGQRGLFAPTRVAINRNSPVAAAYLDRVDAVAHALSDSGAFTTFGPDVDSRYVLDLTLERLTDDFTSLSASGGGGRHGGMDVAVPVTGGRHTHRLTAVVYRDGESTHAYRYAGDFETRWRISGEVRLPVQGPEDTLIANLVNQLIGDLDRDDAIARVGRDSH